MLDDIQPTCHEFKILLTTAINSWQSKQEILAFLGSRRASFVEEIVDGIDTPTSAIKEDENCRVLPIGGDSWSSAWRDTEDIITTKFFTVFPNERVGSTTTDHGIYLLAGQAFGNGQHATTESCLKSLESIPTQGLNSGLDIGTGTPNNHRALIIETHR